MPTLNRRSIMKSERESELHTIIKRLRLEHGYTQQDVARVLKIDKSTYAHYEAARRTPDIDKLKKLATLYGLTDQLLGAKLPIVAKTVYPKKMLDNLEAAINSCAESTGNYKKDYIEYKKLKEALAPVMKIRDDALDLPNIPVGIYEENITLKQVELDMRAEKLIFACIDKQGEVMGWNKQESYMDTYL